MNCETKKRGKLCGRKECERCFSRSFASHENSKYLKEERENPLLIARRSQKKYWFKCGVCNHSFEASVTNVSQNCFCPFCSSKKLCPSGECKVCFEKSFASHEKAEFWSKEKNKQSAREVFLRSNKKFSFVCGVCEHSFEMGLNHVYQGSFCPFCSNKQLCFSDCKICFEKSFASHKKVKFWSKEKNKQSAREVFSNSHKKYWFDCGTCKHSFEASLDNILSGKFCPFCSNRKLCPSGECKVCFEKSFASHEKAEFWSKEKNNKNAREVFSNSGKKYWFECENKHKFSSALYSISSGCWCPKCKHKTEKKLLGFLEDNFQNPIHQFKVSWCKNPDTDRFLPFDFCISKTIIELDGIQHYRQVRNWKSPEEQQKSDRYKEECALKNGYSVLRILQDDVWNDKIDWKKLLLEHVKDYETPVVERLWEETPVL
ncbi:putative restriction endonuclease [Tunisvirus fontaine2]|uniref:Putative restriction endonuclease n=1 Tax=Tunisvirus fontaine2 TaxID=1421067 RepID=V9SF65_9VIRU|nr:putative restriction endonuclease [Tunisvirus fontaine2]AHC54961.1 putative restriction endonuclease [Tunisvirus fontaine2]